METALAALLPFFDAARSSATPLALATLISTQGSTYRKSGAQMLIAADGDYAGLLSGGCLEGDLREHARTVIATGLMKIVCYDMLGPDEELWGLGSGCEGVMEIVLQRVSSAEDWQPLRSLKELIGAGDRAIVTQLLTSAPQKSNSSHHGALSIWRVAPGSTQPKLHESLVTPTTDLDVWSHTSAKLAQDLSVGEFTAPIVRELDLGRLIALPYSAAPSLLLLGAGPDARPLARLAHFMDWRITVCDHRATMLDAAAFPPGSQLLCGSAESLRLRLDPARYNAVVIMSHHLTSDRHYLRALAAAPAGYTGLLGPASRRDKLLQGLTLSEVAALRHCLRAPVGLDLGGRNPEAIALAIVADVQSFLHHRRA